MDCFPRSKVGLADNGDLKKSNKRKQAPNDAVASSLFGHAGLCKRQGEKAPRWLYSACYQPPDNTGQWVMGWSSPLFTHEKAGGLIFPLPRSAQASCSAGSLIFSLPLTAWFALSFCPQTLWFPFWFLIQHIHCEHLRWICVLFFKLKLYFSGLFCVQCTQTPMVNKCLWLSGENKTLKPSNFT